MKKKYFGTDGIRGKVNGSKINGEMFFKFGLAAGTYFKNLKKKNKSQLLQKILDCLVIPLSQHLFQVLHLRECISIH